MKQGLHQSTALRQELRMNPRLYQAMDLLYMPLLDLQQHLKQELLVNPFLELVEPEDDPLEEELEEAPADDADETDWEDILLDGFQVGSGARDLSQGGDEERFERVSVQKTDLGDHLRDQLQMLELTDRERLLAEEFIGNIGEDGYLQASLEDIQQGVNSLIDQLRNGGPPAGPAHEDAPPAGSPEGDAAAADDQPVDGGVQILGGDASSMLGTMPGQPDVDAVAVAEEADQGADAVVEDDAEGAAPMHRPPRAAGGLTPAGVSGLAPFTLQEVEAMMHRVHRLDPPGVGARDLRECLLIQMEDAGDDGSLTYVLVREHFGDLIAHRWGDIAKRRGIEPRAVQDAADALARLDPKPGLRFLPADDEYVTPDLIVEKIDGEYRVFLNDSGTPRLRISQTYKQLAGDRKKFAGETKEFVTEKMNSAQWLVQAIEQRRQTMLKVMNFIVDRQREFFEKGIEFLRPLTLREVAEVIDMHESTVSRVTNQKYCQTPRGVYPLKFFFSSSLGTTSGEDASARAVRAQIQKLVSDEDTAKPLTDSAIVEELKRRGIQIARRTVAKYRDQLGILPARMRKRL